MCQPACRQALFPGLRNYKLDTINDHLEIEPFNHHRAVDDAMALAKIFCKMLEDLAEKKIERLEDINIGLGGGNKEVIKKVSVVVVPPCASKSI